MTLLSQDDQQKYRLAHKKDYVAFCDWCDALIPAGVLYVVKNWAKRKDKLLFLGAIAKDVMCLQCDGIDRGEIKLVDGLPVSKVKVGSTPTGKVDLLTEIKRGVLRQLKKYPDGFDDNGIVLRLHRKTVYREYKKGQIIRTLRQMKKMRLVRKYHGNWVLPKEKVKK